MLETSESRLEREDSYMSIEPADDDNGDTDDGFTVKHIAAARFQRNHRLMQDILQDTSVIPSGRNIVTQKRLNTLREQVSIFFPEFVHVILYKDIDQLIQLPYFLLLAILNSD